MGANEKHAATYHGLSDDTVRGRYCDGTHAQTGHTTDGAEYDTWLAGVKAEAKAEAWEEGWSTGWGDAWDNAKTTSNKVTTSNNPYKETP